MQGKRAIYNLFYGLYPNKIIKINFGKRKVFAIDKYGNKRKVASKETFNELVNPTPKPAVTTPKPPPQIQSPIKMPAGYKADVVKVGFWRKILQFLIKIFR